MRFTKMPHWYMRLVSVEERIREAVNEALESGSQVVSAPGAQWIQHP